MTPSLSMRIAQGGLWLLLLSSATLPAFGQDVAGFWDAVRQRIQAREYLRLSGSIQAETRFNSISGLPRRADGFSGRLNAGLMLDVVGIKAPLAAAFSDGDLTYRLPAYAFVGASPTYRWVTVHAGDRVLNFSPYTLSGHNFRGVGLELRPGKFYLGAMAGRLRRARLEDADAIQRIEPAYRRLGWGLKFGYDDGQNHLLAIVFRAKDDSTSLALPDTSVLRAQENVILGLQGRRQIGRLFHLELDLARSAFTRDQSAARPADPPEGVGPRMLGLYTPLASSGYHHALRLGVNFTPARGLLGLRYERIDPGYRTLGAIFFNNDLETLTLNGQLPLLNQKVNVGASLGLSRNGLQGGETQVVNRLVGNLQVAAAPSARLNLQASWSNFTTTNRYRLVTVPVVQVDSVVLLQTNTTSQLTATWLTGPGNHSVLTGMLAYHTANSIENDQVQPGQAGVFYTGLLAHQYTHPTKGWQLSSGCLFNQTHNPTATVAMVGPNLGLRADLWEGKAYWQTQASCAWVFTNGAAGSTVLEGRAQLGCKLSGRQDLQLRLSAVNHTAGSQAAHFQPFTDWNASLGYRLAFQ